MNPTRLFASLTFRFMFSYVAALSFAVFIILAFIWASYSYNYYRSVNETIRRESVRLLDVYAQNGIAAVEEEFSKPQKGKVDQHFFYLLADANRNRLSGTLEHWPSDSFHSWLALEYKVWVEGLDDADHLMVTHVDELDGSYYLVVARNFSEVISFERVILHVLVRSMLVTILLGALGGAVVAASSMRNIDSINRAVESIMKGDLSERVSVQQSRGGFHSLALTINRMLDRLQALMEGMRQVSDNIAHDLRTPLTRLRNHLASLQGTVTGEAQHTVQALLDEADGILATFNALLRIAQIESGNRVSGFQPIDLTIILRDVIELYEPLAADKQIEISAHVANALPLSGDRDLLFQAFANLVDNAIKYTPEGGAISVRAEMINLEIWVEIADSGAGIPALEREKVFRRFYRVESSRSQQPGNGLGLSLVQAVVHIHAGAIALADNHPGLKVTVRLPGVA
ncbi:MAG: HAMP domain-containing sensor histidine kinase [Spongiibacteraceae bacterium]